MIAEKSTPGKIGSNDPLEDNLSHGGMMDFK